jgi:hypothetical protein
MMSTPDLVLEYPGCNRSNNVVSFSRNVVLRGHLFSLNSVAKPRILSVRADDVLRSLQLLCAIACHRRESTHLQRLRAVFWNHAVYVPDLPSLERTVR